MKKITAVFIILSFLVSLTALKLKNDTVIQELDFSSLTLAQAQELVTEKEKDGKLEKRLWQGIRLQQLLRDNGIKQYDQIKFTSVDNYLVRLSRDEIIANDPLIAIYLNGQRLEENCRLIIPDIPGMYWIRNINLIETEQNPQLDLPHTLFFAEPYLNQLTITTDPQPFIEVEGYYLTQLLQSLVPALSGQYLLISRDGISHLLDYDDYLAQAVLVKLESGYTLQSPQMPGGMWIKNIACIQKGETFIIFRSQFNDWQEIKSLTGWQNIPETIKVYQSGQNSLEVSTAFDLTQPEWQNALKMVW